MKPGLILSVAALIAGLYAVDRVLASLERSELAGEARRHYTRGRQLLSSGQAAEAVDELTRAHALVRGSRAYQLALADSLSAAGRMAEAESNLDELLDRDSNEGSVNLAMARLEVRKGNTREADAYYHRALYGTWPPGTRTDSVRMELAGYLASKGLQKELLSELLLLQDDQSGPAQRASVARLFLAAGAPARAASVYRALLRDDPANADAYAGLGQAALAEGDFLAAEIAFLQGLKHRPGDQNLTQRLQLATALNSLDPTPRRLPSREKFERSVRILGLARADLAHCIENRPSTPDAPRLLDAADRLLTQAVKGPVTNELSESRLSAAEELWRERIGICGPNSTDNDPLPHLLHKLNQ